METFLGGKVMLHRGNCLEVLPTLAENSIDSCVTDPPYHLTSIVKRFGSPTAKPVRVGNINATNDLKAAHARAAAGFMGKQWDGGSIAQSPELWAEVYRVLKPGAHLLACGGTRTFHRMACAIEDAGFEIRDMIMWLYGTGFPKSHDVSKGIDRAAGAQRETKIIPTKLGNQATRSVGPTDFQSGFRDISQAATPEAAQWEGWGTALKPACELIILARKPLSEATVAANVLKWGTGAINIDKCRILAADVIGQRPWESEHRLCVSCAERAAKITKHSTPAIKAFTATNNAEPIMSAKDGTHRHDISKPDIGCCDGTMVADIFTSSNTERFGNNDTDQSQMGLNFITSMETKATTASTICASCGSPITAAITNENMPLDRSGLRQMPSAPASGGRWPANLITDGSEEVVRAFPGDRKAGGNIKPHECDQSNINFAQSNLGWGGYGDSGSAARFFYSAKADSDDRLGSKHPTIKPVDLMQYLVRLITPPRGVCLNPFAGTGSTGEAAWREGMSAILIEREDEYCVDICRRMQLALAGPDERLWQSIKARGQVESPGPLFDAIR